MLISTYLIICFIKAFEQIANLAKKRNQYGKLLLFQG
jgi:hypothetical protein